jgi:hypothetical protein
LRVAAQRSGQYGPAISAVKAKAVLSGHWVERSERGEPNEFEALNDLEFARRIREKLELSRAAMEKRGETEH